jgi:hypothetical protein
MEIARRNNGILLQFNMESLYSVKLLNHSISNLTGILSNNPLQNVLFCCCCVDWESKMVTIAGNYLT